MLRDRNNGFVMLGTLVLCLILSLIGLSTFRSSYANSIKFKESVHSDAARLLVLKKLMTAGVSSLPAYSDQAIECPVDTAKVGQNQLSRKLCIVRNTFPPFHQTEPLIIKPALSDPEIYPLMNFNLLFGAPQNCISSVPTDISGISLTNGAVFSSKTCTLDSSLLTSNWMTHNNLEITADLSIDAAPNLALSAAGYIRSTGTISIMGDVTIIAGGDLIIDNILTLSNSKLTLVSATGAVTVNNASGAIRAKIIARYPPQLPATLALASDISLPLPLLALPIGLSRP